MMGYMGYPFGGIKRLFIRRLVEAYLYRTLARADRDVTFFKGAEQAHQQPLPAGALLAHPLCVQRHSIGARAPIPPSRYTNLLEQVRFGDAFGRHAPRLLCLSFTRRFSCNPPTTQIPPPPSMLPPQHFSYTKLIPAIACFQKRGTMAACYFD